MSSLSTIAALLPLVIAQIAASAQPATAQPTQQTLMLWWLLGAAGVAVLLNQIITAWRNLTGNLRESPPPATTYRKRDDCLAIHNELKADLGKLSSRIEITDADQRKIQREDINGVHRRIDALQQQLAAHQSSLSSSLDGLTGQIRRALGGPRDN